MARPIGGTHRWHAVSELSTWIRKYSDVLDRSPPRQIRGSMPGILNPLGGKNTETKPVPDCSLSRREAGTGAHLTEIYGTVLPGDPGQGCTTRCSRTRQQVHRLEAGHSAPGCQQMAQAVLRSASTRLAGSCPTRTTIRFSPLTSSSGSKHSPASCRARVACHCHATPPQKSPPRPSAGASSPRSAGPPSGGGSIRTPSVPGSSGAGSSLVTHALKRRPDRSLICTKDCGTGCH